MTPKSDKARDIARILEGIMAGLVVIELTFDDENDYEIACLQDARKSLDLARRRLLGYSTFIEDCTDTRAIFEEGGG